MILKAMMIYISTYVNDWQEFVKQKLKGENNV